MKHIRNLIELKDINLKKIKEINISGIKYTIKKTYGKEWYMLKTDNHNLDLLVATDKYIMFRVSGLFVWSA